MNWPFFRLNEEHFTFHLQYKHSGTFANRKYEELSYPKRAENVRPHSSKSLKMRPPYSQSSREKATPSSRHKQSLFVSEDSFKIWPSELEKRAWILSREWDARRHFGEKFLNSPTTDLQK